MSIYAIIIIIQYQIIIIFINQLIIFYNFINYSLFHCITIQYYYNNFLSLINIFLIIYQFIYKKILFH